MRLPEREQERNLLLLELLLPVKDRAKAEARRAELWYQRLLVLCNTRSNITPFKENGSGARFIAVSTHGVYKGNYGDKQEYLEALLVAVGWLASISLNMAPLLRAT